MSSPSISVMNCGKEFNRASTFRQSCSVCQYCARFCIVASCTPCDASADGFPSWPFRRGDPPAEIGERLVGNMDLKRANIAGRGVKPRWNDGDCGSESRSGEHIASRGEGLCFRHGFSPLRPLLWLRNPVWPLIMGQPRQRGDCTMVLAMLSYRKKHKCIATIVSIAPKLNQHCFADTTASAIPSSDALALGVERARIDRKAARHTFGQFRRDLPFGSPSGKALPSSYTLDHAPGVSPTSQTEHLRQMSLIRQAAEQCDLAQ